MSSNNKKSKFKKDKDRASTPEPKPEIFGNMELSENEQYLLDLEKYLLTRVNKNTILEIKYRDLPETVIARIENDDSKLSNLKLISIAVVVIIQKIINIQFSDKDTERAIIRVFYNLGIMEKLKSRPLFAKLAETNSATIADDLMTVISKYTKDYTYKSDIRKFTENIHKKASAKAYAKEVLTNVAEKAEVLTNQVKKEVTEQVKDFKEISQDKLQSPNYKGSNYDAKKTLSQNQKANITNINQNEQKEVKENPLPSSSQPVNKPKGEAVYKKPPVKTIAVKIKEGTLTQREKEILAPVINSQKLTEEELLERSNTANADELAGQIATGKVKGGVRDVFGWLGKEGKNDVLDDFIKKITGQ